MEGRDPSGKDKSNKSMAPGDVDRSADLHQLVQAHQAVAARLPPLALKKFAHCSIEALRGQVDPTKNMEEYRSTVFTATFFAGITQAALGFLRLGFLIDFLSHAAIVGFMSGTAITIALQQLKDFLGIQNFTKKTYIVSVMHSVWGSIHHGWNWQTILIGSTFSVFLLSVKYIVVWLEGWVRVW